LTSQDPTFSNWPTIDLLFFGLGTGAALGLTAGRNRTRRPNRFVLRNDNDAGDWLLDHVDDRVFDPHNCLSWRASWCLFAAVFDGRLFLTAGFGAPLPARRTLDFAFLGVVRFAVFLVLALLRFELFLRIATRFFAFAMAVSREVCRQQANLEEASYVDIISQRYATPLLSRIPRTMPCAIDMMTIPTALPGAGASELSRLSRKSASAVSMRGRLSNARKSRKGKTSAQSLFKADPC
jgi:hypothetical protein